MLSQTSLKADCRRPYEPAIQANHKSTISRLRSHSSSSMRWLVVDVRTYIVRNGSSAGGWKAGVRRRRYQYVWCRSERLSFNGRSQVVLKVPRTSKGRRDPVRMREVSCPVHWEGVLYNEHGRQTLYREANILAKLSHPNIIELYGIAFALGGEPAMVMPWCRNGTAMAFVRDKSVDCRLRLVCEALVAAMSRQLI